MGLKAVILYVKVDSHGLFKFFISSPCRTAVLRNEIAPEAIL